MGGEIDEVVQEKGQGRVRTGAKKGREGGRRGLLFWIGKRRGRIQGSPCDKVPSNHSGLNGDQNLGKHTSEDKRMKVAFMRRQGKVEGVDNGR
jgi:hypothetical protein